MTFSIPELKKVYGRAATGEASDMARAAAAESIVNERAARLAAWMGREEGFFKALPVQQADTRIRPFEYTVEAHIPASDKLGLTQVQCAIGWNLDSASTLNYVDVDPATGLRHITVTTSGQTPAKAKAAMASTFDRIVSKLDRLEPNGMPKAREGWVAGQPGAATFLNVTALDPIGELSALEGVIQDRKGQIAEHIDSLGGTLEMYRPRISALSNADIDVVETGFGVHLPQADADAAGRIERMVTDSLPRTAHTEKHGNNLRVTLYDETMRGAGMKMAELLDRVAQGLPRPGGQAPAAPAQKGQGAGLSRGPAAG